MVILVVSNTRGAVKVTLQVPADRVQCVDEKVPPLLEDRVTFPVGTMDAPVPVSFTVTVHVVLPRAATVLGLQAIVTETGLGATCTYVECEPPLWTESPG